MRSVALVLVVLLLPLVSAVEGSASDAAHDVEVRTEVAGLHGHAATLGQLCEVPHIDVVGLQAQTVDASLTLTATFRDRLQQASCAGVLTEQLETRVASGGGTATSDTSSFTFAWLISPSGTTAVVQATVKAAKYGTITCKLPNVVLAADAAGVALTFPLKGDCTSGDFVISYDLTQSSYALVSPVFEAEGVLASPTSSDAARYSARDHADNALLFST